MITYLLKYYLFIALITASVLASMSYITGVKHFAINSLLGAGIIAAYLTHWIFAKQNIWVLYYNLRLAKEALLALSFLLFEITSIALVSLIT